MERAPFKPHYWGEYSRTSFQTPDDVAAIRQKVEKAFDAHNVVFEESSEHRCGYACTAFPGTYIGLEMGVFEERTDPVTHTVEFRHMEGCRYAYSHFMTSVGESLGITFPGRPLPMSPPPLPGQAAPSETALMESCDFVFHLIAPDSPRSMAVQGLRSLGNMSPERFSGYASKLIAPTLLLQRFDDDEMRMGVVYALARMAKGCPANELLAAALAQARGDPNPLVRRLAVHHV